MRLSRGVRNVSAVILSFVLVAVLIVLVRFRPPARVLPPESPEIARLRFSRTENAWYVLQEAVDLIPAQPFVDPRTTVDFQPGLMGRFTGIALPDNDPAHVEWVRSCVPAVGRARDAFTMSQLLMAIEFPGTEHPEQRIWKMNRFEILSRAMLALAALETVSGGNADSVLNYWRDAQRLSLMLRNSIPARGYESAKALAMLARQLSREVQREALPWLIEFDASKPPPRRAAEDLLRMHESRSGGWREQFTPTDPRYVPYVLTNMVHSGPARRVFAANVDAILDTCRYTDDELEEWSRKFPELADACESSFPGFSMRYPICRQNSEFQICLNIMEVVMAIELYRHENGGYPDSLDALSPVWLPRTPRNAMSGAPFFYRRTGEDYLLAMPYSMVDDVGKLKYSDLLISPPEP
jgi:hypothetical protein